MDFHHPTTPNPETTAQRVRVPVTAVPDRLRSGWVLVTETIGDFGERWAIMERPRADH